ncbi:MAG: thiamine diphosphokinase [Anaerolineales bacterium]|nr:thiamine diphosphokinase [Anaerolineales bacterium]
MSRVVIFVNGVLPNLESAKKILRPDDFLLGVDGGAHLIMELGLMPHLVVGDLDSLSEDDLYELGAADVPTNQYPSDKDETDLELGIQHAIELRPSSIVVAAALGGRIDQTLANISLLSDGLLSQTDIRLDDGVEEVFFCRRGAKVNGNIGDVVSLIPWNGSVGGVVTSGLKWTLNNGTLFPHKTRGVSNEMTAETASIEIQSGLLLVVHRRLET